MIHYVYYDAATMQIWGDFASKFMPKQPGPWEANGYIFALVADGVEQSRDHKITELIDEIVTATVPSRHPNQPDFSKERAEALLRASAEDKLDTIAGLTAEERNALGHRSSAEINAIYDQLVSSS